MKAYVVVDLGFGDAGKGLLTDWLVRTTGARLVVRYNGGAQAGHNVVTPEGVHHTFAQFGAGTLVPGVRTFLSQYVVVHPTALMVEAEALARKGVASPLDRITISEQARVTTPFHQAANRLREAARGDRRHGSVGVGVGETVADSIAHPHDAVIAGDLRSPNVVRKKLARIRERKRAELSGMRDHSEWSFLEDDGIGEAWIERAVAIAPRVVPNEALATAAEDAAVVFEGAQGVLLDETFGFHPYTTWSDCTTNNARSLVAAYLGAAELEQIGVVRTHAVRHGPGPLPTETKELSVQEHNAEHRWQGPVRYGWFDAVLVRYALRVLSGATTLAVTYADTRGKWRACGAWRVDGGEIDTLDPASAGAGSSRLTELAERARPVLVAGEPLETIASLLGRSAAIVARGPTALDVTRVAKGATLGPER
jgi:adenylosuccinate synthase